jgi:hypothetical protein
MKEIGCKVLLGYDIYVPRYINVEFECVHETKFPIVGC